MSDENAQVDETIESAPAEDACPLCACEDCPGNHPDTTAELAQHSKACPVKHY